MQKNIKIGTILGAVTLSMLSVGITVGSAYLFYNKEVLYPSEMYLKEEETGRYALSKFQESLNSNSLETLKKINAKSYLAGEESLQNDNEIRNRFIQKVLSSVSYTPLEITKQNKYGGDYYPYGQFRETIKDTSMVLPGEEVVVSYIDYNALEFSEEEITTFLANQKVNYEDEDYTDKLIDGFSEYIASLKNSEIPLKEVTREVKLDKTDTGYKVSFEEDEWLDKELFSSEDFRRALDRFSEVAIGENRVESKEYREWMENEKKGDEPYQWDKARYIPYNWIGFYDILKGNDGDIDNYVMPTGDGSFENPAGLNTPVLTTVVQTNDKGEQKEYPVKITLLKVSYGSDAIKDLIALNRKNRGLDPKSLVKYIYTEWRVESLTSEKIIFKENSALSDKEGNISDKTGNMYGLSDVAELEGFQWTTLQGWSSSTELSEKYLIWGRDFSKQLKPVWFKALQLSDDKVEIPEDKIQTDDISANKNEKAVESSD